MKTRRYFKLSLVEWAVILLMLAVFVLMLLPAFHGGGPWLPKVPPSEDRRVFHPKGFSIVSPPGWKLRVVDLDDHVSLSLTPGSKAHVARLSPILGVSVSEWPPNDLSKFDRTSFLNSEAYSRAEVYTGKYIRCNYTLVVNRSNQWFEVFYSRVGDPENPQVPDAMMPYIHSFRPTP